MTAIPNKSDGDVLTAPCLFKIADETVTRGYAGSPAALSETTLLSMTVPANTFSSGAMINALVVAQNGTSVGSAITFNLKTGSPTDETTRFTQTANDKYIYYNYDTPITLVYFDKAADYTEDVSIKVTGKNAIADSTTKISGAQLLVFGV